MMFWCGFVLTMLVLIGVDEVARFPSGKTNSHLGSDGKEQVRPRVLP